MNVQTKLLINGEMVAGQGEAISVLDPATGQKIAAIPSASSEQVENATAASHEAFENYGQTTPAERAEILTNIANVMNDNAEELAALESLEVGKPWPSALDDEMPLTLDTFRFFAGGGRGIGLAIVARLLRDGFRVVTCGRGTAPDDLPKGAVWVQADVSKGDGVAAIMAIAPEVHVLVNNAGVQVEKTVQNSTDADYDLVMDVNCRGTFNMCRAVLPGMSKSGGSIINIGSISGMVADPSMALYNASKVFVHGLTRSIAVDHGPNVRCNAIRPGWIMTAMAEDGFALAKDPEAAMKDALARHPVGRFGTPDDIAMMVSWLASDEAPYVTGECFTVDGGMTAASPLNPGLF